ncbi:hypothetical protein Tco_1312415 [Tanacetum coccineum]
MTDVILPQVQATQEIEDTHVTLTPVNPDGQQQSSSVSSGFVSNMLNPNQDTGVDDIFGQHTEATSLIDTPATAIMEPSFTAQTNRPPTPNPLVLQIQQPPIQTPATTTSSSLQNLPNFASLFGFDYRLKALEDNFSELRQTNQYAEALSSIPGIVDQYLANKMQEAVDVAVQLKYDRIREESNTANQQFLDSVDEGMKKIIKEQVKKEVSKITPKIEKLVTDQLESEVLVRSSKEANTSHAVAANLSELELKKILIDKMEANNSINRSDIQRQLYKALVDAYEADKILLDTYGDTVTIKRPRDGADDDQEPSAGTDRGSKRRRSGKEPASTSAPSETTTTTAGKTTTTGSKTHKKSASQSAPVEETMQTTDVFEAPAHQEFETGVHDEQAEEEVQHLPDWFQQPTRLPSPDHAWNKSVPAVHESVQPWLSNLAQQDPRESFDELTDSTFDFSAFVMNRLNVQTHVTLTPVNPDGQQQSSSVSSGFVSNMLNPNQDTGVDDIFGQHTEATSLIDTPVTAIMEPSFTAQTNRPPTPYPLVIQTQQPPILTPATTTSSSLQNLPNFASLFGFDYRLKALEDNFSELRQTNQYAEALSSIPGTVDQYLANKMQEAVDVAVQLKYDRIREESTSANQQFLDSIDDGMKKIIKEQVKKEVSKIIPKIEKLVTDQLESEVLVRSSKEANTSHAVAANLSELELKKILIDKMEANNSINRSDIQRQLYKALVDAYEADKILLDTYGDTVTIKRPRDGADDDQEPSAGTDRGSKRRRSGKEPASTSAPSETTTKTAGKTTSTGSKTHKKSASQSAPVEETMQTTDVFEAPAHQEFETGVHDEQAEEEVQHLPDWFQQPTRLPSPDHAWNKSVPAVHESVQPWLSNLAQQDPRESFDELTDSTFDFSAFVLNRLNVQTLTPELLAGPTFELMKGTCKSLTELEYFCEEVYKATTEKLDWINPEGRQYPHDLRQPLPLVPNSQGRRVIPFHHFINNDLEYLRGGVSSRKYSTSVTKTKAADYGHIKWIEDLVPNSMWSQMIVKYDKFALWGISHWGKKRRQFYAFATSRESARDVYSKRRIIAVTKVEIVEYKTEAV